MSEHRSSGWKHGQVGWDRLGTGTPPTEPSIKVVQNDTVIVTDEEGALTLAMALLDVVHPGRARLDAGGTDTDRMTWNELINQAE